MTRTVPNYSSARVLAKDRTDSKRTSYRPADMKRGGGGKANWGRVTDAYDEAASAPLNEPFEDADVHIDAPTAPVASPKVVSVTVAPEWPADAGAGPSGAAI